MNIINKPYRILLTGIFTIIALLGFTSSALANGADQPNYGDPISVDGAIGDWDLTQDYFVALNNISTNAEEANAYLRFNNGVLYILVLANTPQTVNTANGQFVMVDQLNNQDVNQTYVPADGTPPDFAWVNQNGSVADGWEASILWANAIDPQLSSHQILIHTLLRVNGTNVKASAQVPLNVYSWDFGDLQESYQTTYDPGNLQFGPVHLVSTLRLGQQIDGEFNGQPGPTSLNDDLSDRPDEDGIVPTGDWRGSPTIQYTVNGCTGICYLNAWIDWDHSGAFDQANEFIINQMVVTNGVSTFSFSLPSGVSFPATFNARFRLCNTTGSCSTPGTLEQTEIFPFGEVEDYQWSFSTNAITINSFTATPTQSPLILASVALAAITFVGLGTIFTKRKTQKL